MHQPLVSALAIVAALVSTLAEAAPTPEQAAVCVAALKSRAEPLAQRVRQGELSVEAQLLTVVTDSFAFIGTSYKQGVEQDQANVLLKDAETRQLRLPPAELARVQDSCQAQGEQLLANANGLERLFVRHAARARVDRLKRPVTPPAP